MCERCVIAMNNFRKSGTRINKIYYSNDNGTITKISPTALTSCKDHHISKFFRNNNYNPSLCCECS